MKGKWIWLDGVEHCENQRGCFGAFFHANERNEGIVLKICASTRYIAYLNGEEIGRGPVRSGRSIGYYDVYSLDGRVSKGENFLAVRVWNYGWSTYQSLQAPGGVIFEVSQNGEILLNSDEKVYAMLDEGHQSFAPKRNVNLGFTDYYDGRKFDGMWMEHSESVKEWAYAKFIPDIYDSLKERDIRPFNWENRYPAHIVSIQQVKKGCQQITVNTRKAFFGERYDADETIFSGMLGFTFESPENMEGKISFPNRTWNGLFGDFRIDGELYSTSNANRDILVQLKQGEHFFLMQFSGKYDDLYCHLELDFPKELKILADKEARCFFTVGPTQRIIPVIDGFHKVYGGLNEYNRMESETEAHCRIFGARNINELMECVKSEGVSFQWVEPQYVFEDAYFLSLARTEKVIEEKTVTESTLGILWANDRDMCLEKPDKGDYSRVILDFGDVYVGSFEFLLRAEEGTVVDVYCFENMYSGEIDYTIGLNNGFRYICKEGWQKYKCMTRMGARYAMITIRNTDMPVKIRDFHIRHMTYSVSKCGEFACDDFLLNKIWDISCHTHTLCMEDTFTDCPTFEQAFWIGDAQLTALINMYIYGDYEQIHHNLEMVLTSKDNTPLFNALTPTDWNTSIPMWTMNWIISIDQYIEITGDKKILDTLYENVKEVLTYYEGFVQPDGGFLISAWNMMDWADFDIHNYGVVTGQQAILAWCYYLGAKFAKQKGAIEDGEHFLCVRNKMLEYIDEKMWNSQKKCYIDGWSPDEGNSKTASIQTHILMYLYNGILDEEKRKITEGYLIDPPNEFAKAGSPYMLCFLHECLCRIGYQEQVLQEIRERWGEMLHYDSTTCWEVFPGFYENSRTRSYCHSWSAAPVIFCLECMLGIKRVQEGWKKISIAVPERTGNWCRGAIPTPLGVIRACWERKEKTYKIWLPEQIEIDLSKMEGWDVQIVSLKSRRL